MNKSYKYKLMLLAVGAAALFAGCSQDQPEGFMSDEIRITATSCDVATKGLIDKTTLEAAAGAQVQIYDFLTGFDGSIDGQPADVNGFYYINDVVTNDGSNNWSFTNNVAWRWTRTGVHHFYGWLTKDKANGLTPADLVSGVSFNATSKVLSVPAITFTKDTKQFDFSYSEIVTRDVASTTFNKNESVIIPLHHLFTALDVEVINQTNVAVSDLSVKFTGFANGRAATIDYSGTAPVVTLTDGAVSDYIYGTLASLATNEPNTTPDSTPIYSTDSYRLLWPQDWSSESATTPKVSVTCTIGTGENLPTTTLGPVELPDGFQSKMLAGTKYKLTLTLTAGKLYVNVTVADWIDAPELEYILKMNTNMRLFDSWLYRYDTDGDYSNYTKWATSHMAVSEGRDTDGRPLRSPQIQLVTTGVSDATVPNSGTFELRVDNPDFEILRANKASDGSVSIYDSSTDCFDANNNYLYGALTIPAGDNVYTYFYIVPKDGVTPSDPVAKVSLIYNDPVLGPQKVTYNYSALPGYSDDSSEIWAYYFPAEDYLIKYIDDDPTKPDKLRMYFQDYNHPLVPTPVQ